MASDGEPGGSNSMAASRENDAQAPSQQQAGANVVGTDVARADVAGARLSELQPRPRSRAGDVLEVALVLAIIASRAYIPYSRLCDMVGAVSEDARGVAGASFDLVYIGGAVLLLESARGRKLRELNASTEEIGAQVLRGVWVAAAVLAMPAMLFAYTMYCFASQAATPAEGHTAAFRARLAMLTAADVGRMLIWLVPAAVTEELIFRGALLRGVLRLTRSEGVAVVASAAVFAAVHLPFGPRSVLITLWGGVILGMVYLRSRSLISVGVGHYLANVTTYVAFVLTMPGSPE